jgi:DNA polymerase-1
VSVLLLDANNLTMRGIHAMAKSTLSADGVPTGPLLVVINALSKHIREERPDRVVACWDAGPSRARQALFPAYKANRPQVSADFDHGKRTTFGLVKEFLALAGIHQVEREGYEADDLIAWYVGNRWQSPPKGIWGTAVVLSSDKDFLQLVGPGVEQVRFTSGGGPTDRWDLHRVEEEYGCLPEHLPLVMALAGDVSDGIPGVPRFGTKTAVKALVKADWVLEAVDHPGVREHWDQVQTSLQLVDLRTPLPELHLPALPMFAPTAPGSALFDSLVSFLTRYQLDSVRNRFYTGDLWKDS